MFHRNANRKIYYILCDYLPLIFFFYFFNPIKERREISLSNLKEKL